MKMKDIPAESVVRARMSSPAMCFVCRKPTYARADRMIDGRPACSDCYWQKCGDSLDKHPIYRPGTRRG